LSSPIRRSSAATATNFPNTPSTYDSIGAGSWDHEDYDLTNQSRDDVVFDLEVSIESDFADLLT